MEPIEQSAVYVDAPISIGHMVYTKHESEELWTLYVGFDGGHHLSLEFSDEIKCREYMNKMSVYLV